MKYNKVTKKRRISKHLELCTTDTRRHFFRYYSTDILSFKDLHERLKYNRRCRKHTLTRFVVKIIVKRIAYYLMSKQYKAADNEGCYYNRPRVTESTQPLDFYPSCHDSCKKYCHGGSMFYALRFRDLVVFAHTEYGLYLEVIRKFILEPHRYPFC